MTADPVSTLPTTRTCPYAPPAEHRRLREETPLAKVRLPSGRTVWAATRHEDIRVLLSDPRFSSNRRNPGFPSLQAERPADSGLKPLLLELDPPEHGPARRAVIGEFTVRRITALTPRIQQIVDEHIDAMLAGPRPVDLVQALALPVPSLVICEMLSISSRKLCPSDTAETLTERLDSLVYRRVRNMQPGCNLLGRSVFGEQFEHLALFGGQRSKAADVRSPLFCLDCHRPPSAP